MTKVSGGGGVEQITLVRALEAILFVADEPIEAQVLAQALDVPPGDVESGLDELGAALGRRDSGLVLRNIAGGWRLATHPDLAPFVERFVLASRHARLTKASLETLAIVAYKQPVTRHQITAIRGVNSDGVLRSLQDRGLIEETGREDVPGRPVLYGTTNEFLERLGLPAIAGMPPLAPLLGEAADALAEPPDLESSAAVAGVSVAPAVAVAIAEALDEGPDDASGYESADDELADAPDAPEMPGGAGGDGAGPA